jgi:hypothetical protein
MRILSKILLTTTLSFCLSSTVIARDFTLLTSEPIRNAKQEVSAEELFIEVIREVFKRAEVSLRVDKGPWIKAQRTVTRSNPSERYLIAPLTRLSEREDKYDWILPLSSYSLQFVTTDKTIDLSDLESLKKEDVCVFRESAAEYKLKEWEFPDILSRVQVQNCFKGIKTGKLKVVLAHGERVAKALYEQVGGQPEELIFGRPFSEYTVYMAATKSAVGEGIKQDLLRALDEMKIDGTYDKIFSKYK